MHIGLKMPINSPSAGGRFDSDLRGADVKSHTLEPNGYATVQRRMRPAAGSITAKSCSLLM